MRSISRVCDVSPNTVDKLLVDAGNASAAYHFNNVVGVKARRIQCDEIWSFCYSKKDVETAKAAPVGAGDVWTWTAIDADSKLIVSYLTGSRELSEDTAAILAGAGFRVLLFRRPVRVTAALPRATMTDPALAARCGLSRQVPPGWPPMATHRHLSPQVAHRGR